MAHPFFSAATRLVFAIDRVWAPSGCRSSRHRRVASPRFVEYARRAGFRVQVWTVDAEDAAARLLSWGVDDLITDRPDRILPLVRSWP